MWLIANAYAFHTYKHLLSYKSDQIMHEVWGKQECSVDIYGSMAKLSFYSLSATLFWHSITHHLSCLFIILLEYWVLTRLTAWHLIVNLLFSVAILWTLSDFTIEFLISSTHLLFLHSSLEWSNFSHSAPSIFLKLLVPVKEVENEKREKIIACNQLSVIICYEWQDIWKAIKKMKWKVGKNVSQD